jgi:tRNA threonylcarbamoyladenosine biosynthesis protein TsaE
VPTYRTRSEEETIALGERLAAELPERGAVLLIGNLGAGKTTLAKGIVKGRGAAAPEEVSSPTFTLIHEYGSPAMVFHVDWYRIDDLEQARRLGLQELWEGGLVLVEWGEKFPELTPAHRVEIELKRTNDDERIVEVRKVG